MAVDNFERLANQHQDAVYRHMVRVCGNRDAEDVLIEALKAYRHLDQLRDVVGIPVMPGADRQARLLATQGAGGRAAATATLGA